jgi:7tm Chemosensory receptor
MVSVYIFQLLRVTAFYHFYLYRIAGLLPFTYNSKKKQFKNSPTALFYSHIYTLFLIFYHPVSIDHFLASIQKTRFKVKDRQITMVFYHLMNLLMVSLYLLNIYYRNDIRKVLNQTLKLLDQMIVRGSVTGLNLKSWILFNAIQSLSIHLMYITFVINFLNFIKNDFKPENLLHGFTTIFPFYFWALFLNTYTNLLTVLLLLIRRVNQSIEVSVSDSSNDASILAEKLQTSFFVLQKVSKLLIFTIDSLSHLLVSLFGLMFGCLIHQV